MPGYKTHIVGAAAVTGGALAATSWLGVYRPGFETMVCLGLFSVLGGLFPDVDTDSKGRRIFHVPGQQDYAATRIDTAHGERWFCSAAEAVAAGWTAAAR